MSQLRNLVLSAVLTLGLSLIVVTSSAQAAADRQPFLGAGLGFEVLSKNGSGTGFYFQGMGGYAFDPVFAIGLHTGYSRVGIVGIELLDFGSFVQLTEPESGLYGKVLIGGVYASREAGDTKHGVAGNQVGFAPGVGAGMLIPSAGSFHMVPELTYRAALLDDLVSVINASFNLVWDF